MAMLHEFGDYALGLYDESESESVPKKKCRSIDPFPYSLMDHERPSGDGSELSSSLQYADPACRNTAQFRIRGCRAGISSKGISKGPTIDSRVDTATKEVSAAILQDGVYAAFTSEIVSAVEEDGIGQVVRHFSLGQQRAGVHQLKWDGRDQAGRQVHSGVYIYRLEAGAFTQSRKMILLE